MTSEKKEENKPAAGILPAGEWISDGPAVVIERDDVPEKKLEKYVEACKRLVKLCDEEDAEFELYYDDCSITYYAESLKLASDKDLESFSASVRELMKLEGDSEYICTFDGTSGENEGKSIDIRIEKGNINIEENQ
jgi:hypothetical protein